jgi:Flp pilus assembly protein TadD
VAWAFGHTISHNWQPLTVLSHMLDCQLFGLNPGGHHFTNVLLHTAAVILLFLLLNEMSGALWPSAFAAALFAIHPLRAESVAWIAERKDVLSALFFVLTLSAYLRYVRRPSAARYAGVALTLLLGLLSKPMLVTTPFVLLLLDYWPLRRLQEDLKGAGQAQLSRFLTLVREKIPLFGVAFASVLVTLFTQSGAIRSADELPFTLRISNGLISLLAYLWQMIWPARLAAFYPYPKSGIPLWETGIALCLLLIITVIVFRAGRKRGYLITGWFWYLIMMLPVLGIVQVGLQARADRYTYLPQIGIYMLLAFLVADVVAARIRRELIVSVACLIVLALSWRAWAQVSSWRDGESLWKHAIAATGQNDVAESGLADAMIARGQFDEAISHAREAVRIRPDSADAHNNLGVAFSRKGRMAEARDQLERVVGLNPERPKVHYNLATVFLHSGQVEKAIEHFEKELQVQPGFAEARNNLGIAFTQKGDLREAIVQWRQTLQLEPNNLDAQCNIAWILATSPDDSIRDGREAIELARRAVRLSNERNPRILRLLAASYAEAGQFPEATGAAECAQQLAIDQGNSSLAEALRGNIEQFRSRAPLRDKGQTNPAN